MFSQSSHRWTVHILLFVIGSDPIWSDLILLCAFFLLSGYVLWDIMAALIWQSIFVCIVGLLVSRRYHFLISWFFMLVAHDVTGAMDIMSHDTGDWWMLMCCEYIHTVSGRCSHYFVVWWPCMLFSVIVRCLIPINDLISSLSILVSNFIVYHVDLMFSVTGMSQVYVST